MGIYDAEINDFPLIKCLWTLYEIFSELGLCYPCHLGGFPLCRSNFEGCYMDDCKIL